MAGARAHFLHIGKTGGTAVKAALAPVRSAGRFDIVLHGHATRLADVPGGDAVFFFVRDPVARFVSGFNSRLRQGRPRYNSPWSEGEKAAFSRFRTADELGCALSAPDPSLQVDAARAMREISHVRQSYWHWFEDAGYFASRASSLLLVGRQERLADDFAALCELLGVDAMLPVDDIASHRSPADVETRLTAVAVDNLRRWYARDYAFLELCSVAAASTGPIAESG